MLEPVSPEDPGGCSSVLLFLLRLGTFGEFSRGASREIYYLLVAWDLGRRFELKTIT